MTDNDRHKASSETALVTAVHRDRFELKSGREIFFGRLKRSIYYGRQPQIMPTVGDFVLYTASEGNDAQIVETLPRKSYFARRDPDPMGGKEQAVAANFDYVFIMSSLNHDFNPGRIERYVVQSHQSGAVPVVILTKADLQEDLDSYIQQARAVAVGIDIIPISIVSGDGLSKLGKYLQPGKTVVFLGMSGVGKSSLLNKLMGYEAMDAREIREDDSRGRHTTTHRQLFTLPSGAMAIDTPGMRILGMWESGDGLSEAFADIEELLLECRFADCKHQSEPGCAIRAAIQSGDLDETRLQSYLSLQQESSYAQDKASYLRGKEERGKMIAKHVKQMKRDGRLR